jgi:TRAP-type uncharacterized transport system fused permease subunit
MNPALKTLVDLRIWASVGLIVFQYWIMLNPQQPLFERPIHLIFVLLLAYLWFPLKSERIPVFVRRALDVVAIAAVLAVGAIFGPRCRAS